MAARILPRCRACTGCCATALRRAAADGHLLLDPQALLLNPNLDLCRDPFGQVHIRSLHEYPGLCAGLNRLADGRLIVTGGDSFNKTSIYDPATNQWSKSANMKIGRGYQVNVLSNLDQHLAAALYTALVSQSRP